MQIDAAKMAQLGRVQQKSSLSEYRVSRSYEESYWVIRTTERTVHRYDEISSDPSGFCLDFYRQHSSARPIMEIFGVNV